ncbi:MAG: P27 family phage terminase small subunit [Cyanobacteria bacterium J06576_12]
MVEPPEYLDDRAKEIFVQILPQLGEDVLYQDVLRLAAYADNASKYESLSRKTKGKSPVVKDRDGDDRRSPDQLAAAKAFDQWSKCEAALGLERRQRIKTSAQKGKNNSGKKSLRKPPRSKAL